MKKLVVFLVSVAMAVSTVGLFNASPAESAQVKPPSGATGNSGWKKTCKQTNTGKQCTQYIDYYISASWSKANVKKVYKKFSKYNSPPMTAFIDAVAAYSKHPVALGVALTNYGIGSSNGKFESAYHKGKGLKLKYTYRMTKSSSKGTIRNTKWSYY